MPINPQDLSLRLQTLEAVAGEPLGAWSQNPYVGWQRAKAWVENEGSDMDPLWTAERDHRFWSAFEGAVLGYLKKNMGPADSSRNTPEEAFSSILMGIPLGAGQIRDPLFRGIGKQLRTKILRGQAKPLDVLRLAIRGGKQRANDELRVSGDRIRHRDEGTDLTAPGSSDDPRHRRQLGDPGQAPAFAPEEGGVKEFLGKDAREAVIQAITRGMVGEGQSSPIWQRLISVWLGQDDRFPRAKASPREVQVLQAIRENYRNLQQKRREQGEPGTEGYDSSLDFKWKDVAGLTGLTPAQVSRSIRKLGDKINTLLKSPGAVEDLFNTPQLRQELTQQIRLAKTRKKKAAERVALRWLEQD